MAKKWYQHFVTNEPGEPSPGTPPTPDLATPSAAAPWTPAAPRRAPRTVSDVAAHVPEPPAFATTMTRTASFDEIYAAARIQAPAHGYTILKVAEMLQSEHICSLPPDVKRKSVLVALEAAGVPVQEVIEDAVRRDRALDAFERTQQKALEEFEATVRADSARLQGEIDTLIADKQAQIRTTNEALAKEVAAVKAWRDQKLAEEGRIADAVGHFVSENPVTTR